MVYFQLNEKLPLQFRKDHLGHKSTGHHEDSTTCLASQLYFFPRRGSFADELLDCCKCNEDNFDLCLDCWGNRGATCLDPMRGPLWVHGWSPPNNRG